MLFTRLAGSHRGSAARATRHGSRRRLRGGGIAGSVACAEEGSQQCSTSSPHRARRMPVYETIYVPSRHASQTGYRHHAAGTCPPASQ